MTERLPWFRCFPAKLLGALAGLDADEQLVYVTVLLRIYEVGGASHDTPRTLSLRTSLPERRVSAALRRLIRSGKIVRSADGLFNEAAAHEITERNRVIETKKQNRSKRGQNIEEKQRNKHHARTTAEQRASRDLDLDKDIEEEKKEGRKEGSKSAQAREPVLAPASLAFKKYNETAEPLGWPLAQILSKKRRGLIAARLAMCGGLDGWAAAMGKAAASNFLTGRSGRGAGHENWLPDLDWFLKASNFTKLMEGSYDNRINKPGNGTGAPRTELQSALDKTREYARSGDQPGPSVPEGGPARRG